MENKETQEKKKKSPIRFIILAIVLIGGGIFGFKKIQFAINNETTDNAQVETQITPVLPRVAGYVKRIAVNDYDSVLSNELLVELDDDELQTQLNQMQADYQAAEADIANARAALNNAVVSLKANRGNIDLNDVKVQQAKEDFDRNQNLFNDQAITRKQLNDSRFALEQANQQLNNSKSDLGTAETRIAILQSTIKKSEAILASKTATIQQQKLKISYTKIYSPAAGRIGKRNVTVGQFVQAGTPLFSIVSDSAYWIIANFKETQIKKFREGMSVELKLDAFPDTKMEGKITSLSDATGARFSLLPPDNASGNFVKVTQRIPVKISIDHPGSYKNILRAGLSVDVTVPTN